MHMVEVEDRETTIADSIWWTKSFQISSQIGTDATLTLPLKDHGDMANENRDGVKFENSDADSNVELGARTYHFSLASARAKPKRMLLCTMRAKSEDLL